MKRTAPRLRHGPVIPRIALAAGLVLATLVGPGCGDEPGVRTFPAGTDLNWVRYAGSDPLDSQGSYGWNSESQGLVQKFEVDRKGGEFRSGHVTLDFPPNVLEGSHTLTVRQPNPADAVWDFTLDPPVAGFNRPVKLVVDYLGYSESTEHSVLWLDESRNLWVDIGGKDFPAKGYCTVDLWHFSTYGVTDGTAGWD